MFNKNQEQILSNNLDSSRIKKRNKANISLSYLEGFDVIENANKIFGYGNWEYQISSLEKISQEVNDKQNFIISYKAIVKVIVYDASHSKSISRQDVGFGTGIAKTLADSNENSAKEAVTDALKRSLRSFGNQFGNSLYDKSRNYNSNQVQNSNYAQAQTNPYNNYPQSNNNQYQTPYKHQQDFSQLINLGLSVVQQGDNLIVVGENVFANKDIIKQNGFRWDSVSKSWYIPLRQVA